jgi:hypothetical protein
MLNSIVHRLAAKRLQQIRDLALDPARAQETVLNSLISRAWNTSFGRAHGLDRVRSHRDWVRRVPLSDYASMEPWWKRAMDGERDVCWPGQIRYWAISSGTTAGEKYLPVSMDTIRGNRHGGLDAVAPCLAQADPRLFSGKLLFLGGSTTLRKHGDNWIGDNTGIMTMHIPPIMRRWHTPGQRVAGMTNWEQKIEAAAEISARHDVRLLSGVPSWIILFAEKVLEKTGKKTLKQVWPNLALFVHGGMSIAPYRQRFLELVGGPIWCTDTYSASEGGMLGVQDDRDDPGMLALLDQGVFFEFVPEDELDSPAPARLTISQVEPGVDYAVVLNTDSGIFGYLVGDLVRFTTRERFIFAGRIKHTLNAFGEHVSGGELDRAVEAACKATGAEVEEFAVAVSYPDAANAAGGHAYYIEFRREPGDTGAFASAIDSTIRAGNEDYAAHRTGEFGMRAPVVRALPRGKFYEWMKARGRLGGQNKVPRVLSQELEAELLQLLSAMSDAV